MKGVKAASWTSVLTPGDGDPRHGINGYTNLGCRCEVCRSSNVEVNLNRREVRHRRMLRGEVTPTHGAASTYYNYKCRCRPCKDALAQEQRDRRAGRLGEQR